MRAIKSIDTDAQGRPRLASRLIRVAPTKSPLLRAFLQEAQGSGHRLDPVQAGR